MISCTSKQGHHEKEGRVRVGNSLVPNNLAGPYSCTWSSSTNPSSPSQMGRSHSPLQRIVSFSPPSFEASALNTTPPFRLLGTQGSCSPVSGRWLAADRQQQSSLTTCLVFCFSFCKELSVGNRRVDFCSGQWFQLRLLQSYTHLPRSKFHWTQRGSLLSRHE